MIDPERLARIALGRITEPGKAGLLDAVTSFGAVAVLDQLLDDPVLGPRLGEVDSLRELEVAARTGLRFVVPGDDEWPSGR